MAYYSYSNYDEGEYNRCDYYSLNSNYSTYYPVPVQDSFTNSNFNSSIDYQIFAYDPIPSKTSYSVSIPTKPDYIEYDPAATQFSISYSVAEFNETEFEDYDPTPYGGGYDLVLTYGNPLPPSDEICYPRSAAAPAAVPLNSFPSAPVAKAPAGRVESESKASSENGVVSGGEEEESKGWYDVGSGSRGEDGKQAGQLPYGYGLEAMDICESLFGYWPCISRYRRRLGDYEEEVVECGNCNNPWNGTADYLFGNPNPYEEKG